MSKAIEFEGEILQSPEYSGAAYLIVPFDVEKIFGKKRVKVKVLFDGKVEYRGSLVRMGSPDHILILRKDVRAELGKTFGNKVQVQLNEDTEPRVVKVPEDFQLALDTHPNVLAFFKKLSYTHQKEYVQWIEGAKRAATRQNRIVKAIEMMKAGKKGR